MSRIYEALKRAEQIKGTSQAALSQEGLSQPACAMPVAAALCRCEEAPRVEWVRRDGGIRPAFILDGRSQVRG